MSLILCTITEAYQCVPCLEANAKRAPIPKITTFTTPFEELHLAVSGPVHPSLGGNTYVAHFLETYSLVSTVSFLCSKAELLTAIINKVSKIITTGSTYEFRVRRIRSDNDPENLTKELQQFHNFHGIEFIILPHRTSQK